MGLRPIVLAETMIKDPYLHVTLSWYCLVFQRRFL